MSTNDVFETDVPARLDRLPWSRFHWLVVIALGITWILDGLEVTLVGSLAGAISGSPRLPRPLMQPGVIRYSRRMRLSSTTPQPAALRAGSMCSARVSAWFMANLDDTRACHARPPCKGFFWQRVLG